jgi:hypothetical protein
MPLSDMLQIRLDDVYYELLCLIQHRPDHEVVGVEVEDTLLLAYPEMLRCLGAAGCMCHVLS